MNGTDVDTTRPRRRTLWDRLRSLISRRRRPDASRQRRRASLPFTVSPQQDPPLDQAVRDMLLALNPFLPGGAGPALPDPSLSLVSVKEGSVGVGNRRGMERRGPLGLIELKGLRLDSLVRFQLWSADSADAETAANDLNLELMTNRDGLRVAGVLRLALEDSPPSELVPSVGAWRKTADYRVLYEHRYEDAGDAESLLVRIPIEFRLEGAAEATLVTDEIIRWDNESAADLQVRGGGTGRRVAGLAVLAHPPAGPSEDPVTLSRLDLSSGAPPNDHANLNDFLSAVGDPDNPDLHAQVVFPTVANFLTEFELLGDPFELGDWGEDGTPDAYQAGVLAFEPAIKLEAARDALRISYGADAFGSAAVLYLRVGLARL